MESTVKFWKAKFQEEEKSVKSCLVTIEDQRLRICELLKLKDELESMKDKVKKQIIPQINKEMLMKKKIAELYIQLGETQDNAQKQCYTDVQEWDSLLEHMSQPHIVEQFIEAQEKRKEEAAKEQ